MNERKNAMDPSDGWLRTGGIGGDGRITVCVDFIIPRRAPFGLFLPR